MDLNIIVTALDAYLDWENQSKDSYELEFDLLHSLDFNGLELDEKVRVSLPNGNEYIVFKSYLDNNEVAPYYYSKEETNIDLEQSNELFKTLDSLL